MRFPGVAIFGVIGLAGLSLIGAGVYASGRHSQYQSFDAHDVSVVLSASGATGNHTPAITLSPLGPTSSSFETSPVLITITNNGNVAVSEVALQLGEHGSNPSLAAETWVCLYSDGNIFVNEPLAAVEGYGQVAIGNLTLAPGATDSYTVVYYAGTKENTGCGGAFTGYSATPYNGYPGQYDATEPFPSGTTNPAAPSLTNLVEGESITPTVTVTYVGAHSTLVQVPPFGESTTVKNSGNGFIDHLDVARARGAVTYVVTSTNSHLQVSSSGTITTVGGPLAVGTYSVAGTDSDVLGDTGTWTYTLTVVKGTIECTGSHDGDVRWLSWGDFDDQLSESGSVGHVTYTVTSPYEHLQVSSDGKITTYGTHLPPGSYTISGDCSDSYGDTGTWSYTLTVSK